MDPTEFTQRLQNDEIMIGFSVNYPTPGILENIGSMWDFLWLDGQHGQLSYDSMLSLVRTADLMGTDTLARVPSPEQGIIGLYADIMPTGLMVPMVNTAEAAAAIVNAAKFPPLGTRSFGGRRPIDLKDRTYYRNKEPIIVAQIETPEAVKNALAIAKTDGIDVLMLGPDDIRVHLGLSIDAPMLETPVLLEALETVVTAARTAGKSAACITPTREMVNHAMGLGYRLFIGGSDAQILNRRSFELMTMMKETIKAEQSNEKHNNSLSQYPNDIPVKQSYLKRMVDD